MNRAIASTCLLAFAALASFAQPVSLTGRWIITEDFFGTPRYMRLQLQQQGTKLAGDLGGNKLEGTVNGSSVHFVARNEHKDTFEVQGAVKEGVLTATMIATDAEQPERPYKCKHPVNTRIAARICGRK